MEMEGPLPGHCIYVPLPYKKRRHHTAARKGADQFFTHTTTPFQLGSGAQNRSPGTAAGPCSEKVSVTPQTPARPGGPGGWPVPRWWCPWERGLCRRCPGGCRRRSGPLGFLFPFPNACYADVLHFLYFSPQYNPRYKIISPKDYHENRGCWIKSS